MPDNRVQGEVGYQNYQFNKACVEAQTTSGSGPCDTFIDPTERRVGLPFVYGTILFLWSVSADGLTWTLATTTRKLGTAGLSDSGASVNADIGVNFVLDESMTSMAKDGFFYAEHDYVWHQMGIQQQGPLFVGATFGGAAAAGTSAIAGSLFATTLAANDDIQQLLFKMLVSSYSISISVDSETKCDWLYMPMEMCPASWGIDNNAGGSQGTAVVGNLSDARVNWRARGGSVGGRDISKRLITTFQKGVGNAPSVVVPAALGLPAAGGVDRVIVQAMRVAFFGCPTDPLQRSAAAPDVAQMSPAAIAQLKKQLGL